MDARKASRYGALTGLVAATALIGGMSTAGASTSTWPVIGGYSTTTHSHLHGVVPTVQAAQAARGGSPAITSKTLQ
jgi:hypothetical protein